MVHDSTGALNDNTASLQITVVQIGTAGQFLGDLRRAGGPVGSELDSLALLGAGLLGLALARRRAVCGAQIQPRTRNQISGITAVTGDHRQPVRIAPGPIGTPACS